MGVVSPQGDLEILGSEDVVLPAARQNVGVNLILGSVTAVLMVKDPSDGPVKTRLSTQGCYEPAVAAEMAEAMLRCTAARLARASRRLVLAVSPDGRGSQLAARLDLDADVADQGTGDLGERLDRVWRVVGIDVPVAFFGADTPDVPDDHLRAIPSALRRADVAVGATADGGYWTLAAGAHHHEVITGIDWGSGGVYDQTLQRAVVAGLVVRPLPVWHDVDRPEDVDALRVRLRNLDAAFETPPIETAPLRRLAEQLDRICSSSPTRKGTTS